MNFFDEMLQVLGKVRGLCTSSITTVVGTTRSDDFQLGSYNDSRQVLICEGDGTESDSSDAAPQAKGPGDRGKNKRLYRSRSPVVEKDATSKRLKFEKREGKGATSRVVGDNGRVRVAGGGQAGRRSGSAPPGGSGASGGQSGASGVSGGGTAGSSIGSGSGQVQGGSGDGGGRRDGSGRKRKFDWSDERAGGSKRRRRRAMKMTRMRHAKVADKVMKL
jgi:hypothetical protein